MRLVVPSEGPAAFAHATRLLMRHQGDRSAALAEAEDELGREHAIVTSIKAATSAGTLANAAGLASPGSIEATFIESLRSDYAFDAAVAAIRPVPLDLSRVVVITQGVTGSSVGEGTPKPISRMTLTGDDLAPVKVAAIVILSAELARLTSQALYVQELRSAVGTQTDAGFAAILATGAPSIAASGATATAFFADLSAALDALALSAASRVFMIGNPATIKALSMLTDSAGGRALPDLGLRGGTIADITVIATDGVAADTSGGDLIVFDAAQLAANPGTVFPSVTQQASVQLDDQPTDPVAAATVMGSLWQQNLVGIRVERYFLAHKLRATAATIITGANYGAAA